MLRDRISYFLGILMAIPVFPLMLIQARRLKKDFPDLPEANNPMGKTEGKSELSILMLGESSIAGVGVEDHKDCISGQLAMELSALSGRSINWQVVAKSGYTARQVREYLLDGISEKHFDIIVIGLGGNDTFKVNSPWYWKKSMRKLALALHSKYPKAQIVITYMPPVHTFLAFSPLIRFFLGNLTKLFGREMKRLAPDYTYLSYFDYVVSMEEWIVHSKHRDPADFFSDGVHPSALTYELWGKDTARFIHQSVLNSDQAINP
ncbi:MAG: SGNH/GDSL hydrolase family protein [Roseivirga sp.]|nr:SGNH/GDSL hydrolase family protein [Roseivirga sp.]